MVSNNDLSAWEKMNELLSFIFNFDTIRNIKSGEYVSLYNGE